MILFFGSTLYAADIALIHSYSHDFPWVMEYRKGFISQVGEYEIVEYEMDTKRKNVDEFEEAAGRARAFIQLHQPKLVVLADDNALKLLGPNVVDNGIPLVFLGINANPRTYIKINRNVTGTIEKPLLKRSISLLRHIVPKLKKVLVLMDLNPTSSIIYERSFDDEARQFIAGIQVDISLETNFPHWKNKITHSKLEQYDAIIIANYASLTDEQGNSLLTTEIIEWTNLNTPVPLFAFWSYSIGKGKAIGGLNISGIEQGIEAAKKVNFFFENGKLPIITTPSQGSFIFSQYELTRWNIVLPPNILSNSEILE